MIFAGKTLNTITIALIALSIIAAFGVYDLFSASRVMYSRSRDDKITPAVKPGQRVHQVVPVDPSTITGIEMKFGTFRKHLTGIMTIRLADPAVNAISDIVLVGKNIQDNQWITLDLDKPLPVTDRLDLSVSYATTEPDEQFVMYGTTPGPNTAPGLQIDQANSPVTLSLLVNGTESVMNRLHHIARNADLDTVRGSRLLAFSMVLLGAFLGCLIYALRFS